MGRGGREVDAELNLVPYINLLSTLIAFLLLSTVWFHINALSTKGQESSSDESVTPPDEEEITLSVSIYTDKLVAEAGRQSLEIAHIASGPNFSRLSQVLSLWKENFPDKNDVTVHTDSRAPYRFLIETMDTLIGGGFEDVGISTR